MLFRIERFKLNPTWDEDARFSANTARFEQVRQQGQRAPAAELMAEGEGLAVVGRRCALTFRRRPICVNNSSYFSRIAPTVGIC